MSYLQMSLMTKGLDYRSGVVVASQMSNKLFSGSYCTLCLEKFTLFIFVITPSNVNRF